MLLVNTYILLSCVSFTSSFQLTAFKAVVFIILDTVYHKHLLLLRGKTVFKTFIN